MPTNNASEQTIFLKKYCTLIMIIVLIMVGTTLCKQNGVAQGLITCILSARSYVQSSNSFTISMFTLASFHTNKQKENEHLFLKKCLWLLLMEMVVFPQGMDFCKGKSVDMSQEMVLLSQNITFHWGKCVELFQDKCVS